MYSNPRTVSEMHVVSWGVAPVAAGESPSSEIENDCMFITTLQPWNNGVGDQA